MGSPLRDFAGIAGQVDEAVLVTAPVTVWAGACRNPRRAALILTHTRLVVLDDAHGESHSVPLDAITRVTWDPDGRTWMVTADVPEPTTRLRCTEGGHRYHIHSRLVRAFQECTGRPLPSCLGPADVGRVERPHAEPEGEPVVAVAAEGKAAGWGQVRVLEEELKQAAAEEAAHEARASDLRAALVDAERRAAALGAEASKWKHAALSRRCALQRQRADLALHEEAVGRRRLAGEERAGRVAALGELARHGVQEQIRTKQRQVIGLAGELRRVRSAAATADTPTPPPQHDRQQPPPPQPSRQPSRRGYTADSPDAKESESRLRMWRQRLLEHTSTR
eukprot:TRINITY_DN21526_c0_g1_i2.p1 TRINITY_DN21526_c0_g1~~TRINITY_DN21526_c0_g1_i2.p1  ORF type:complete len:353 (+),score=89.48 TRINITY_DN21526_c0_g1_i2:54-1061(+)